MSERMIVNRVKKLKALEAQQKEIEAQIEALKDEIKATCRSGAWSSRWPGIS